MCVVRDSAYFKLLLTNKSEFGAAVWARAASREEQVSREQVSRPRAGRHGGTLWLSGQNVCLRAIYKRPMVTTPQEIFVSLREIISRGQDP